MSSGRTDLDAIRWLYQQSWRLEAVLHTTYSCMKPSSEVPLRFGQGSGRRSRTAATNQRRRTIHNSQTWLTVSHGPRSIRCKSQRVILEHTQQSCYPPPRNPTSLIHLCPRTSVHPHRLLSPTQGAHLSAARRSLSDTKRLKAFLAHLSCYHSISRSCWKRLAICHIAVHG